MTTTTSTSRRSSSDPAGSSPLSIRCSVRADGDFHLTNVSADVLERNRRRLVPLPWTMTDQRHGIDVVRVDEPGQHDRAVADIAITERSDVVLGVWAADCAPLVVVGDEREFAVVHAGWRGLAAGVVDAAIHAFSEPVAEIVVGPAIGPCCYEFGDDDLHAVAAAVGADVDEVRARTSWGTPALDVFAAVSASARSHGVTARSIAGCTGCAHDGFSHRVRRDPERHVVAAWRSAS